MRRDLDTRTEGVDGPLDPFRHAVFVTSLRRTWTTQLPTREAQPQGPPIIIIAVRVEPTLLQGPRKNRPGSSGGNASS